MYPRPVVTHLLGKLKCSLFFKVAYALGCLVLGNADNQEKLLEESAFKYDILLELLATDDEVNKWQMNNSAARFLASLLKCRLF